MAGLSHAEEANKLLLPISDSEEFDGSSEEEGYSDLEEECILKILAYLIMEENEELANESSDDSIMDSCWSEFQNRRTDFRYTGTGGIRISSLPSDISPEDALKLFLDEELLSLIVTETNRYALQSSHEWQPITTDELMKFFVLNIWMGLVKMEEISNYWSLDPFYKNYVAPNTMSQRRFQAILRNLNFANNEQVDPDDRIGKVRPLLDELQKRFQNVFTPQENIVVNQSFIPWKGGLVFLKYLPFEAHQYGVKLFKLSSTKGYCWSLQVYDGKTEGREVDQALKVCQDLTLGLREEGRTLFVDNFYASYSLAKYFLDQKTHVVGTLRPNRASMPKAVLDKKLKRWEMIAREDSNGIVVMKWKGNRNVSLLTTKHEPVMEEVTLGHGKMMLPAAIRDYKRMETVIDIDDDVTSYATVQNVKWYRKLAFELLLGVSVDNARLIFQEVTNSSIGIREFRQRIVESLLNLK